MMGVQEQRNPSGYNVPVWFSGGKKKKRLLNEYVFICHAFFSFPNKLPSAPLVRREMIELKRYFSLQISLLMGAGRQESIAPQNPMDNKAFGRRPNADLFSICSVSSDQQNTQNIIFFVSKKTDIVGMPFITANIIWWASTDEDIQYY